MSLALLLLIALAVFCAGGLLLVLVGLRGRVVGDDPHCRKCGFNLRGRDEQASPRCPECGTDLAGAEAIRIGVRRRRPALLTVGLLLLLLAGGAFGVRAFPLVRDYDWMPWRPMSWLIDDVANAARRRATLASNEIMRRLRDPDTPADKVNFVLDHILRLQADRAAKWDPNWSTIFETAAALNRVDAERLKRYVRQGVSAKLEMKPKIRRGRGMTVELSAGMDRIGTANTLRGRWLVSPLMIGDAQVMAANWASHPEEGTLSNSSSYTTGISGGAGDMDKLPDGKHVVRATVTMTVAMEQPVRTDPLTFDLPVSVPIELHPKDAVVDEFKADPDLRERMRAAITAARVTRDETGRLDVRLRVGALPMPLSARLSLRQGAAEQRVGATLIPAGEKARWQKVYSSEKPRLSGVVDICLRPSQDPADDTKQLATYWGEEIIIPGIAVDAPYQPPFVRDDSLRPAIEKALTARPPRITRTGKGTSALTIHMNADKPPVKLSFQCFLARQGRELKFESWTVPPGQNYGRGSLSEDIDPDGKATSCDIIFRPDPNWETNSYDLNPPWYGEIMIRDVKIGAAGEKPKQ